MYEHNFYFMLTVVSYIVLCFRSIYIVHIIKSEIISLKSMFFSSMASISCATAMMRSVLVGSVPESEEEEQNPNDVVSLQDFDTTLILLSTHHSYLLVSNI